MRYERREPRQEDQREITELKERCESQERDLARLTETLRQLQIIQEHHPTTPPGQDAAMPVDVHANGRRILASPAHNCDVIYEEQEPQEEEEDDEQSTSIDETEEESSSTCHPALEVMMS